ncbi:MAG TPA: D-glucuronyl C5-epimerase family protein [Ktedonobacteraceae bacterium]|nr:D-glucuronyl C5-epimerase family protein [Ktedonobacteraceae bacterium]
MHKLQAYPTSQNSPSDGISLNISDKALTALAYPADHPCFIAQEALAHWNRYLKEGDTQDREGFLKQANWFLAHKRRLANGACVWPIPFPRPEYYASGPCLSASAQGSVISVLIRAYQLTGDETFLQTAHQAVRPFELDILDGGVSSSLNESGLFFEDIGVYPAAHILSGYILALFGLYDYVFFIQDHRIADLIQRSLDTLHMLLDAFDTGYWTRDDLLHNCLASRTSHALHVSLLEALANISACEHCATLAKRWAGYQDHISSRLHSWLVGWKWAMFPLRLLRRLLFGSVNPCVQGQHENVCVPITQFPISGGMKSVLAGIAQAMDDHWQMIYLTNYKGPDAEGLEIETFGQKFTHPWQFPGVWLYSLAGLCKMIAFLRRNPNCRLVLPQDGLFTGVFAALVGKMAGVRVVCIDHGNITWLGNPTFRQERMRALQTHPWYRRIFSRLRFACYWPTLALFARVCARFTDLFLIAGDETADVARQYLGIHPSRIIRYDFLVDITLFPRLEAVNRAKWRAEQGIPEEAILITMINRLAVEKGVDTALAGMAQTISALSADERARVRILLVGDGPLRAQIQADIQRYGLDNICTLWGNANSTQVAMLLGISDIFLYNGTRGVNSMAVLEAMAAGCAVIASTIPHSNIRLLAQGRGIAIEPNSADAVATALTCLCRDLELCHQMGERARDYIATWHTAQILKRSLWRATFFAPTIENFVSVTETSAESPL